MSKLLKSKFLLGAMVVAFALALSNSASADCTVTPTVKVGSTGASVTCVQTKVGVTADGSFGPKTKAAVMAFQSANGLTADGVVGPMSAAKMNGTTAVTPSGALCPNGMTLASNCSSAATSTSSSLSGGAADITATETSTDVETTANEGATTKVHGFKVQADGGDVAITNVKVTLEADGAVSSSYRLNHYADKVSVWMGSTKVGSADVADFTKTGNVYTKSIALTNAIVKEGSSKKQTFYVTVDALENIDTADFDANWTVTVNSVRFQDSTGVVLTGTYDESSVFSYTSLATSGDVKVVVSKDASSPVAQDVTVSDTSSTKNVLLLAFKVKATGSDVTFDSLNITDSSSGTITDVIGELQLKNGSDTLATIDGSTLDGTDTFTLDDTFTISEGTTEVFKIYATVNDSDNFVSGNNTTVNFASFSPEDSNGDVVTDTGSATGSAQAFVVDVPTITKVGTPTLALLTHTDGTTTGLEDTYKATIKFNVHAPDSAPVYVPLDTFSYGTAGTAGVQYTVTGGATVTSASVQYSGSDDLAGITESSTYRIDAGSTQEFTLVVNLTGNDANGKVTMTGLSYELSNTTPNNSPTVSGLSNFYTNLLNLAK